MVSCTCFSEIEEFQVKEVLESCLLWALVQVLSPGKSPGQPSRSQRVALILSLCLLWLAHWASLAIFREGAQPGHWWVSKAVLGRAA